MVRVTIETNEGDLRNGSAFHIGDGWLVTASHVLNAGRIKELVSEHDGKGLEVESVIHHVDERVDIAIIKTNFDLSHYLEMSTLNNPPKNLVITDHVEIGGHLDDFISDDFVLSKVLLMGYPPIPFSNDSILVAAEGEVNAVVDKYNGLHPHFIISCMGRGGYSGGPVLSEYGFLLGIMTESLVQDNQVEQLGYSSAISIEPLLTLLYENSIYPGNNREIIETFFAR